MITSWSLFLNASLSEEYGILLKASLLGARIWRTSINEVKKQLRVGKSVTDSDTLR